MWATFRVWSLIMCRILGIRLTEFLLHRKLKWYENELREYTRTDTAFLFFIEICVNKRQPTYKSLRRYKKRSTDWPFQLKFTKHEKERYRLTDGTFYHNHVLTMPVLDPQILWHLNKFDPVTSKPAQVRKFINQRFNTDISYAQIAYELSKRKKQCGHKQYQNEIKDFIDRCNQEGNGKVEYYCDKSDTITRVLFLSKMYFENYKKYRDLLIIYKYENFFAF